MVVVLLSGGLDSSLLMRREPSAVAVFVDYGQPAAAQELRAAIRVCALGGSKLVQVKCELAIGAMADSTGAPGPRVVGGRNAALLAIGVNVATQHGCDAVWIGAHMGDADNYPDCRPVFLAGLDRLFRQAYGVGVAAPLLTANRAAIRAEAAHYKLGGLTWSCYAPADDGQPCGTCNSCLQDR